MHRRVPKNGGSLPRRTCGRGTKRAPKLRGVTLAKLKAPEHAAKLVGLRYVSDGEPGFRRKRRGNGFVFLDGHRKRIRSGEHLTRIRALAIPPA